MAGEGKLQSYFKRRCAEEDLLWRKMEWSGRRGGPDCFVAGRGKIVLVELKNLNGKGRPSKLQEKEIERLITYGVDARIIDSKEGIEDVIKEFT